MEHVELLPIPPIESATDPIHSAADMCQRLRAIMGPLGFGERLLRFCFVGPDRCLVKILSDVAIPSAPDPVLVANLLAALSDLLAEREPGATVAFLLTRPGPGHRVSNADRRWASLVTDYAAEMGVPIEPFFRANDDSLVLVAA
ncbi:hypothetical protein C6A85_000000100980 [Mycobacterium sp. ITM-2017-0098]|nr:hypothetical protein C6A85_000000100980 [Mycobacterium sp. ITM-2017-0098]